MEDTTPPRLAKWLVENVSSRTDREFLLGDLEEGFSSRVERDRGEARRWYWAQVLHSLTHGRRSDLVRGGRSFIPGLDTLVGDSRRAMKGLRRQPGIMVVVVLTLALGIGSSTAVFGLVHAVLLNALPYENPAELVRLRTTWGDLRDFPGGISGRSLEELNEWSESATWAALLPAGRIRPLELEAGYAGVVRVRVTWNLLDVLGVEPVIGRLATRADADATAAGQAPLIFLTHGLWESAFARDPGIVGRTLRMAGDPKVVAGILPEDFQLWLGQKGLTNVPPSVQVLEVLRTPRADQRRWGSNYRTIGRLREGVSLERLQAELPSLIQRFGELEPGEWDDKEFHASALLDDVVAESRSLLLLLMSAVTLVLLVACANGASLLVARAEHRQHELAIRSALGAGRAVILREILIEGVVLSAIVALAGMSLAGALAGPLAAISPEAVPRADGFGLGGVVLVVSLAATALVTLAAMLGPAWHASRVDPQAALQSRTRGSSGARTRLRSGLVIAQLALSVPMITSALLLWHTTANLRDVDLGFDPAPAISFSLLGWEKYSEPENRMAALWQAMTNAVEGTPEITALGGGSSPPLSGLAMIRWRYSTSPSDTEAPLADVTLVQGNYFDALGLEIVDGRSIVSSDMGRRLAVVDELLAAELWADESPIGQSVYIRGTSSSFQVIGVTKQVRSDDLKGVGQRQLYLNFPNSANYVIARANADRATATAAIVRALATIDPDLTLHEVRYYESFIDEALADTRFLALLLMGLAATATALTASGVFGITAYLVRLRQREMGIRMALGARSLDVVWTHVRNGLSMLAIGLPAGLLLSAFGMRFLGVILYGVPPLDPLTFVIATVATIAVVLAASFIPARVATQADPVSALRSE